MLLGFEVGAAGHLAAHRRIGGGRRGEGREGGGGEGWREGGRKGQKVCDIIKSDKLPHHHSWIQTHCPANDQSQQ